MLKKTNKAAKTAPKVAARRPVAKSAVAIKSAEKVAVASPTPAATSAVIPPKPAVVSSVKTPSSPGKRAAPKAVSPIVRESFTMTTADQELLKKCKRDAIAAGRDSTKKSEVIRAALRHFASLTAATRLMEMNGLDPVKTGRPKKQKK